ncbi:uncharacterized protein EI90DRAFT_2965024 [Cantharellus anzutake]|uniref:uncharacterized protein n=1 Tax=Cantharellus anzutake TaxID=1750568 RepID=UPI0019084DD4|nr:uncharacterized protein EI90DRAFT_2965024 [Cantharellus anzutake]KAF8343138.1 hypothetical protein EI90DRAFT_2965024 [Cantharellus anzutake]
MSKNLSDVLVAAAWIGDVHTLEKLISEGARVDGKNSRVTPLIAAVIAGHDKAVGLLLEKGANIEERDEESRTIIKLALDNGHEALAQKLVDHCPGLIVTDPRLRKGEEWLRKQFKSMSDNVKDTASKPDPSLLERVITGVQKGDLGPTDNRSVSDVYWEHILLRYIGDIPLDIERNYSEDLTLSLVGTFERILKGHEGIKESARLLNSELPTTEYTILDTVVRQTGSWVTERWAYHDSKHGLRVTDGIDTFLIENGKITVKMINYTVEKRADAREEFKKVRRGN